MKLYLSGPMTGLFNYNRQSFDDAEATLKNLGFEVINPANLPEPVVSSKPTPAESWAAYLVRDILLLQEERPDFVVLLPGAEHSNGSCLESRYAKEIGLATITLGELLSATYRNEKPEGYKYSFPWPRKTAAQTIPTPKGVDINESSETHN